MKRLFLILICFISLFSVFAQEGRTSFDYLLLPNSARISALGGSNVSLVENDVSLIYSNPAFLGYEMDLNLSVSYLAYIADIGMGNATFAKTIGERSAWGVGFIYANYGNMKETTPENVIVGDLNANDICANIFFAHDLSDRWRGGITGKFLYSNYYHNTAIGLGVDLGLSYYNSDRESSFGIVGKNIGRQIKAYEEELSSLPWDIQMGYSQKLENAPIRFSITGVHLNRWKFDNLNGEEDSFFTTLAKHLVFGVDLIPSDNFWIGLGYSVKRSVDMHLQEGNTFGGWSAGAGFRVKSFSVGCSVGRYHPAANSFMLSISTSFADTKL